MKRLLRKLENIYAAAAYAEEGEHDTAREIMRDEEQKVDRITPTKRPRKEMRAPGRER
ncbi:MAG: hypothetical protein HY808_11365 [Nitrospirae bacterium]|nr:hypothetical protein [Nitrospirota bacterium]MBI5057375.1 hypothetical protein [Nitrospirota bacterium]